jgi:integrase
MAKTRGKGEGSIYQRSDGYWVGSIEAGRYPNGQRRKARVVRRYRSDVVDALHELRNQVRQNGGVAPDRTRTVEQYLSWWLPNVKAPTVSDSTIHSYTEIIRRITKEIGHVKLHDLRKGHVQQLMNCIADRAPATQQGTHSLLKSALQWAVDDDILPKNPVTMKAPVVHPKIDDIPTLAEHKAILAAAEGHRLYALWWLALTYGMRQGELIALRWDDIDLEAKTLYVRKAKTKAGVRPIPLIPQAIEVLKAHKRLQAQEMMESTTWHDTTGLVFTGHHYTMPGYRVDARQLRDMWADMCKAAKVTPKPRTINGKNVMGPPRFHTTRKLAGIMLRRLGVPIDIAMRILGHSKIAMTAEVYAIPDEEMLYDAMVEAFAEAA